MLPRFQAHPAQQPAQRQPSLFGGGQAQRLKHRLNLRPLAIHPHLPAGIGNFRQHQQSRPGGRYLDAVRAPAQIVHRARLFSQFGRFRLHPGARQRIEHLVQACLPDLLLQTQAVQRQVEFGGNIVDIQQTQQAHLRAISGVIQRRLPAGKRRQGDRIPRPGHARGGLHKGHVVFKLQRIDPIRQLQAKINRRLLRQAVRRRINAQRLPIRSLHQRPRRLGAFGKHDLRRASLEQRKIDPAPIDQCQQK